MRIIGLTGLSGAGKNYIAGLLEKAGVPCLDADKLGHTALKTKKTALVERFGEGILDGAGDVNRQKLGKIVFADPGEKAALEAISYPEIMRLTREWFAEQEEAGFALACLNAAVIQKTPFFQKLDALIIVKAPYLVRLCRTRKRDRRPVLQIIARFHSQRFFTSQYLEGIADKYYIYNGWFISEKRLEGKLREIISLIRG
jgi:dephospho-CoA kinase